MKKTSKQVPIICWWKRLWKQEEKYQNTLERGTLILVLSNIHSNLSKSKYQKLPLTVENVQRKCLKPTLKTHNALALKILSHSLGGLLSVRNNPSIKVEMNLHLKISIAPNYSLDCRLKKISFKSRGKNLIKKKRHYKPLKPKENWKSLSFMVTIIRHYIKVRWIWGIASKLWN